MVPTGPPAQIDVPPGTVPTGYVKAILDFALTVMPPHSVTFVASRGVRKTIERDGKFVTILPPAYRQAPALTAHLTFALKHEGVNLEVLAALFRRVDLPGFERELADLVTRTPTGRYVRQLWFLYEFLTGRELGVSNLRTGNYVPLLDPEAYYTAPGRRSPRHRVLDNLLGDATFCPAVRKTQRLRGYEQVQLGVEAARVVAEYDDDAIRRAVNYLYTKETRSSFGIEGETPSPAKTERFVARLKSVPSLEQLSREQFVRLQEEIVDPRFAEGDYRDSQVYVAEQVDLARQRIHFVAPRPGDVSSMMEGLVSCQQRLEGSSVDPVVQAAVVAFGFVFIHPFQDGNGRLHRLLIHYILSRTSFAPRGIIFPVSAVMLQRRQEYDEALESFSAPLMRLVDYDEQEDGEITVKNETAHLYRFFDATPQAEALYGWVEATVRDELRHELEFVVGFRAIRKAMAAIVELPDRKANLFVALALQNGGRISPAKRQLFSALSDKEVTALEKAIRAQRAHLPGNRNR